MECLFACVFHNNRFQSILCKCFHVEESTAESVTFAVPMAVKAVVPEERIPPRVEIRLDAPLEMPHIIMLIDDPECTVIEPMKEHICDFEKVYDFDLSKLVFSVKGTGYSGKWLYEKLLNDYHLQLEN